MNVVRKVSGALLGIATLGLVIPAFAVEHNGSSSVERVDNAGSTNVFLGPLTQFCYLSRVKVEDTDGANESADCRLIRNSNGWTLAASLWVDSDASVRCEAQCYSTD
jgi:hypothetical protein